MTDWIDILLVDDNPNNLAVLEAVLDNADYRLVRAYSGKEALTHLSNDDFALILLDVKMPEMDGFETADIIRTRDKNGDIPIIFLTAEYTNMEDIERGYALRAVDYILKPINPTILRARVSLLVDLHRKSEQIKRQSGLLLTTNHQLQHMVAELRELNGKLQNEITEREKAEEELARSNSELEQFAYVASHDLQEPLRKIRAFSDRVTAKYKDSLDEQGRDYLNRMSNAAGRMQTLIDDLLTFSRLTSRAKPFSPIDLNEIVQDVISDLEFQIRETDGNVESEKLPVIDGDATQMRLMFQNLVSNGLKFHQQGMTPSVRISSRPCDDPERSAEGAARREVEIAVADNGIGFDEKYLERIFTIFQRLHGRGEYAGSGIGLAICRKVAERHGGSITANSSPGKGSTFVIRLPVDAVGKAEVERCDD